IKISTTNYIKGIPKRSAFFIFIIQFIYMRQLFFAALLLSYQIVFCQAMTTKFEQTNGTQTPTYFEIIDWWKKLDAQSGFIKVFTMGMTDAGFPLHLVIVSGDRDFNLQSLHKKNKTIILIN